MSLSDDDEVGGNNVRETDDRPMKKARYVWQIKGRYHFNQNRHGVCKDGCSSSASSSAVERKQEVWQTRQMAKAVVDNTVNRVIEDGGLSAYASDANDWVDHSFATRDSANLENAAVMMAIQSHGLQQPQQCTCPPSQPTSARLQVSLPFHHRPSSSQTITSSPLDESSIVDAGKSVSNSTSFTASVTYEKSLPNAAKLSTTSVQNTTTLLPSSTTSVQNTATLLPTPTSTQNTATLLPSSTSVQDKATLLSSSATSVQNTVTLLPSSTSVQDTATLLPSSATSVQDTVTLLPSLTSVQDTATLLSSSATSVQDTATVLPSSTSVATRATLLPTSTPSVQDTATLLPSSTTSDLNAAGTKTSETSSVSSEPSEFLSESPTTTKSNSTSSDQKIDSRMTQSSFEFDFFEQAVATAILKKGLITTTSGSGLGPTTFSSGLG
ncbi:chitinase-like protein PB1E7.04c [Nilaparvata lugens]|uniref:chitinase-like protein PB1E7.04c n=1 Tax=Nilaparvata lugens TaxID=108931 RepID=UPI00193D028D|nr:chitinase-like protein PB1E7.04c [Nilaparvata lugens]XP_039291479.1 chitinase-like protein PB1E7.04c [Nilaparvata lugens]